MDQKPRSRANSVIGQIKWWTSNHHFTNTNNTNNNNIKSFGSSVAVQKLRESKWFGPDESRIFCAVIECGFIVETREGKENGGWFGVVHCKTSKGKQKQIIPMKNRTLISSIYSLINDFAQRIVSLMKKNKISKTINVWNVIN